jgi:hypothetical protein
MRAMPRREPTVADACIAKLGILRGSRCAAFITSWAIASQSLGRPITLEEYAEWWKESMATAYRHQRAFRIVFPHLSTPQPIADAAQQRAAGWQARGVDGLGQLPASLVLA